MKIKNIFFWSPQKKLLAVLIFIAFTLGFLIFNVVIAEAQNCASFFVGRTTTEDARGDLLDCQGYDLVYCGNRQSMEIFGVRNEKGEYEQHLLFFKNKLISIQYQMKSTPELSMHQATLLKHNPEYYQDSRFGIMAAGGKNTDGNFVLSYLLLDKTKTGRVYYVTVDRTFMLKIWCPQTKRTIWEPPLYRYDYLAQKKLR
jgi:hypothetical protein